VIDTNHDVSNLKTFLRGIKAHLEYKITRHFIAKNVVYSYSGVLRIYGNTSMAKSPHR